MCTFENNLLASEFSFLAAQIWCTSKRSPLYAKKLFGFTCGWATLPCLRSIRSFPSLTNANVGSVTSEQSIDSRTAPSVHESPSASLCGLSQTAMEAIKAPLLPFFSSPRWVRHPKETEKALPEIHVKPVLFLQTAYSCKEKISHPLHEIRQLL